MKFFLAFEVRGGTLCSGARGSGPAEEGEGRTRKDGWTDGRKERGGQADIKSNNPHLTGGEKGMVSDPENVQPCNPTRSGDLSQTRTVGPFFGCEYIYIYIYTYPLVIYMYIFVFLNFVMNFQYIYIYINSNLSLLTCWPYGPWREPWKELRKNSWK